MAITDRIQPTFFQMPEYSFSSSIKPKTALSKFFVPSYSPSGCINFCLARSSFSVSTLSSSGTQQSTGQTAAH